MIIILPRISQDYCHDLLTNILPYKQGHYYNIGFIINIHVTSHCFLFFFKVDEKYDTFGGIAFIMSHFCVTIVSSCGVKFHFPDNITKNGIYSIDIISKIICFLRRKTTTTIIHF